MHNPYEPKMTWKSYLFGLLFTGIGTALLNFAQRYPEPWVSLISIPGLACIVLAFWAVFHFSE